MEIVVFASPLVAVVLFLVGWRTRFARPLMPAFFAVGAASMTAVVVATTRGLALFAVSSFAGAMLSGSGLIVGVLFADAGLHGSSPASEARRWLRFERDFWSYVGRLEETDRPSDGQSGPR
jgi:hypothetical protein